MTSLKVTCNFCGHITYEDSDALNVASVLARADDHMDEKHPGWRDTESAG